MKKSLSIISLLVSIWAFSQEADSMVQKPIRIGLYLDYPKAVFSSFTDSKKWEGGFELMFWNRLQGVVEMGTWDIQSSSVISNGSYEAEGAYQRIGFGYLPYVGAESRIGLGFRHATSSFSDRGEYVILSQTELQDDIIEPFGRSDLSATWYELVFYSDKEVNKWLVLGFNFRIRFMQSYDSAGSPEVQIIPGYGRALDRRIPAFNLFLKIQPF